MRVATKAAPARPGWLFLRAGICISLYIIACGITCPGVLPAQEVADAIAQEWRIASRTGDIQRDISSGTMEDPSDLDHQTIWPGEHISTLGNGQAKMEGPSGYQIRMRENTTLRRADSTAWSVETGLAGFRFETKAADTAVNVLLTPWARVECRPGIFILRVAPSVARIAVLKGTADVTGPGGVRRSLGAKQECAAAPSALSNVYEATDDLYFAWYWDKP